VIQAARAPAAAPPADAPQLERAPNDAGRQDPADAQQPRATPPAGLYVHVPFCISHCPYCDFVVVAGREARGPANRVAAFVAALEVELELRADALDARWGRPGVTEASDGVRPALDSLYLGGGTPSLLPAATIAGLIGLVRDRFGLAPGAEVTLEANPGPDERGDASALRAAGVTRLSIGAQSMDTEELRALGRRHTPEDVRTTIIAARDAGFESISLDLVYDVPASSLGSWTRTLDAALDLEPDHLSLYALTLDDPDAEGLTGAGGDHLPIRSGAMRWRERARLGQDDDRAASMYELADRRLAQAGFEWYEISNWARPGHRSRHNLAYWQGGAWEAVGPGAHAYDGADRRWNAARLDTYIAALQPSGGRAPRLPPGGVTPAPLDPASRAAEAAILSLRTSSGLPASALAAPALGPSLAWAIDARLLERTDAQRLVLTRAGRLLSNELFLRLI
jgi:oxygen-independent coproporphyrinogen-3 oxidase